MEKVLDFLTMNTLCYPDGTIQVGSLYPRCRLSSVPVAFYVPQYINSHPSIRVGPVGMFFMKLMSSMHLFMDANTDMA